MSRYLEDFRPGETADSATYTMTADEIIAFAKQFDPQPFHTDPLAARECFFGELVASGWHTAAITMRLTVECGLAPKGGFVGTGVDELRWPRPVVPGDVLRVRMHVLEVRPSRTKPDRGTLRMRIDTMRADGEIVQTWLGTIVVPRDPARSHSSAV